MAILLFSTFRTASFSISHHKVAVFSGKIATNYRNIFSFRKTISKRRVFHEPEKSFRFAKNNSCVTTVNLERLPTLVEFLFERPSREQSSAELSRNFLTLDMICLLENLPEKVEFFKKVGWKEGI